METNNTQTREQTLEAALKQLIQLCATLRYRQRRWKDFYGADNRKAMAATEKKMDEALKAMGVDEFTEYKKLNIKFLSELTVQEREDFSKKLLK